MGLCMNIIGFVGVESCEMICYLGRMLLQLKKRVLLADCSEFGALMECVPEPHFSGTKDNTDQPELVLEHKGLDYLNYGEYNSFIIGAVAESARYNSDYDYLLIDFGFRVKHETIDKCNYLFMCCDQHIYNIRRLGETPESKSQERCLLIKNYVNSGLSKKRIIQELNTVEENCKIIVLPYNENDYVHHIRQRYAAQDPFSNCSPELKQTLVNICSLISPDTEIGKIKEACKNAASGKKTFWRRKAC